MKYQIGEQVWVNSKGVIEIINEVEQIAGQYIYYTFDGNSYGEKQINKYGYYYNKINKILNLSDCSVKLVNREGLLNVSQRLDDELKKIQKENKNKKSW